MCGGVVVSVWQKQPVVVVLHKLCVCTRALVSSLNKRADQKSKVCSISHPSVTEMKHFREEVDAEEEEEEAAGD